MPDLRSSGAFADKNSGGGLFRGNYIASSGNPNTKTPGVPIDIVSQRDWSIFRQDFQRVEEIDDWVGTEIGTSGTFAITAGAPNGILNLSSTTANEGYGSFQFSSSGVANQGAFITAAANRIVCYEVRVAIDDVDDADWFIGIGEVDTTFISLAGALLANGADNHVGFHHLIADSGVPTLSSSGTALANVDSTQLGSGINRFGSTVSFTIADTTFHKYGIRIVGTAGIEFYIDDILVHVRTSGTVFDTAMTPTFCMIANGSAVDMDIDYVMVATTR